MPEAAELAHFNIVLVGKSGSGKSSTGNSLLGKKLFQVRSGLRGTTCLCETKHGRKEEKSFTIVDCPGLLGTDHSSTDVAKSIISTLATLESGIDCVAYVVRLDRYTEEDYGVFNRLKCLFGGNVTKHMTVVFTGGEKLNQNNKNKNGCKTLMKTASEPLKMVLSQCGNRYVIFNNMADEKKPQTDVFFQEVCKMSKGNHHQPYTYEKTDMSEEVTRVTDRWSRLCDLEHKGEMMRDEDEKRKFLKDIPDMLDLDEDSSKTIYRSNTELITEPHSIHRDQPSRQSRLIRSARP